MKKASEYRRDAQERRGLAAAMPSDLGRAQLLEMAEHWEKLAADRIDLITKHPELAQEGEHDEERSWSTRACE
jgi:hypothetical protein